MTRKIADENPPSEIIQTGIVDNWEGGVIGESKSHHVHRQRVAWIDLIRVTSAFLVVVAHATAPYDDSMPGTVPDPFWWFGNIVNTLTRCAVPMFLMVSGYLLLSKKKSLWHGYFNRFVKIGIPLLVWSIIYFYVRWWEPVGQVVDNKYQGGFYDALRNILLGNGEHLWFLYAILSLYLVAPIFHSYLKSASRDNKTYFLLLCGFVCFVWPIISVLLKKLFDVDNINFDFFLMHSSIGYFVVGYFLGHQKIRMRTCLLCLGAFVMITLVITEIGFAFSNSNLGGFSQPTNRRLTLIHYYNMRIPLALLLFVVIKYIGETQFYRQSRLSATISRFSGFAFGIYIVHVLVMHTIGDGVLGFAFNSRTFDPWFSIPLVSIVVFFLSAAMVWLLRKIPLVRWILP